MYIIAAVLSQLFARGSAMKNNDGFFGNGCGWIIVAPLLACICLAVGCWGYNRYGIPEIFGSLLFLVTCLLLVWCLDKLAEKPIKALQQRVIEKQRRDSLLRRGICPECEISLEMVSSTSSPAGKYTEKEETPSRFQGSRYASRPFRTFTYEDEPVDYDVSWVKKQRILHTDQYRCSSCKQEFTRHHTSSHTI